MIAFRKASPKTSSDNLIIPGKSWIYYSVLKLLTGFAKPALIALYPTVSQAMMTDIIMARAKTNQLIVMW